MKAKGFEMMLTNSEFLIVRVLDTKKIYVEAQENDY